MRLRDTKNATRPINHLPAARVSFYPSAERCCVPVHLIRACVAVDAKEVIVVKLIKTRTSNRFVAATAVAFGIAPKHRGTGVSGSACTAGAGAISTDTVSGPSVWSLLA